MSETCYAQCDESEKVFKEDLYRMIDAADKVKTEILALRRTIGALCNIGFIGESEEQKNKMIQFKDALSKVHWSVSEEEIFLYIPYELDESFFEKETPSSFNVNVSTFTPIEVLAALSVLRHNIAKAEKEFLPGEKTSTSGKGLSGHLLYALERFEFAFLEYIYPIPESE